MLLSHGKCKLYTKRMCANIHCVSLLTNCQWLQWFNIHLIIPPLLCGTLMKLVFLYYHDILRDEAFNDSQLSS